MDASYDRWTGRLSEYLDGELHAGERALFEEHLAKCEKCAHTLEELRGVVAAAGALHDAPPVADLWPAIAARLGPAYASDAPVIPLRRRRVFAFSLPQLAAASLALVAMSSAIVWLVASRGGPLARTTGSVAVAPVRPFAPADAAAGRPGESTASATTGEEVAAPTRSPAAPAATTGRGGDQARTPRGGVVLTRSGEVPPAFAADREYAAAVTDMQRLLRRDRARLRPETVKALENSLADVDRALAEARRALARDPASVYLNDHLAETMRLKLQLLRQATALAQS